MNNYRFNGKEFQADLGLNWNHQDWRFLDPQLLRWHAVDPEVENGQESWSPYSFGYDNALRYADANGREPEEGPGDPPSAAGIFVNTLVGIGVSAINTFLVAGDAFSPGGSLVATMSGNSTRAYNNGDGSVSYGNRSVATSGRQLAGYVVSDALDITSTALTIATAGEVGAVSRALPMGAGLLLEQGGAKVVQNEVVQKGKSLVRFGTEAESAQQLGAQAAKAEANGFPHGVSTQQHTKPVKGSKNALRSDVEQKFKVTQTGNNPRHHTVTLPKPVTEDVAKQFNDLFRPIN